MRLYVNKFINKLICVCLFNDTTTTGNVFVNGIKSVLFHINYLFIIIFYIEITYSCCLVSHRNVLLGGDGDPSKMWEINSRGKN